MELQTKNDIIKNLLDTQSMVVESLSYLKDQNNQLTSFEKQQVTSQPNKVSNQYQNNQHQNYRQDNQHQNHRHNNNHQNKYQTHDDIGQKQQTNEFRNILKQTNKRNKLVKTFMWVT